MHGFTGDFWPDRERRSEARHNTPVHPQLDMGCERDGGEIDAASMQAQVIIGQTIGRCGNRDLIYAGAGDIEGKLWPYHDLSPLDHVGDDATDAPDRGAIVTRHGQGIIGSLEIMLALPERGETADNQLVTVDTVKISSQRQAKAILCPIECAADLSLADVSTEIIAHHHIL